MTNTIINQYHQSPSSIAIIDRHNRSPYSIAQSTAIINYQSHRFPYIIHRHHQSLIIITIIITTILKKTYKCDKFFSNPAFSDLLFFLFSKPDCLQHSNDLDNQKIIVCILTFLKLSFLLSLGQSSVQRPQLSFRHLSATLRDLACENVKRREKRTREWSLAVD